MLGAGRKAPQVSPPRGWAAVRPRLPREVREVGRVEHLLASARHLLGTSHLHSGNPHNAIQGDLSYSQGHGQTREDLFLAPGPWTPSLPWWPSSPVILSTSWVSVSQVYGKGHLSLKVPSLGQSVLPDSLNPPLQEAQVMAGWGHRDCLLFALNNVACHSHLTPWAEAPPAWVPGNLSLHWASHCPSTWYLHPQAGWRLTIWNLDQHLGLQWVGQARR